MNLRKTLCLAGVTALSLAVGCGDDDSPAVDAGATGGDSGTTMGTTAGDSGTTAGDSGTTMGTTAGDGSTSEPTTVVDIAVSNPDFSILVEALTAANLVGALEGPGPFTVFAPTNQAFTDLLGELGLSSLDEIPADTLETFLLNHVITAEVPSTAIPDMAETMAELTVIFGETSEGVGVSINEAAITDVDIEADNGVIHVVNDVINPASILDLAGYAGLTGLAGAIDAAADLPSGDSVADALAGEGPFTVFAPNNAAFDALPSTPAPDALRDILLYHVSAVGAVAAGDLAEGANVVPTLSAPDYTDSDDTMDDMMTLLVVKSGSTVTANGATVGPADIKGTNGIVHVVDAVITRPDVVDMAGIAGLTALAGALDDDSLPASLIPTLQMAGPYTVFAPTDAAFGELASVPTGAALDDVLKYHVLGGDVMSDELSDGLMPTMVNGDTLTINLPSGGGVTVTGASNTEAANVGPADIVVTNGVIHVVDAVLLP